MSGPVRVKVCGLTRREDVEVAIAAGVDLLGLNFHAPSPRSISFALARELSAGLPATVGAVGVCVNPDAPFLDDLVRAVPGLRCLQWHGEPPLPAGLPLPLIPAFRVADAASLERIRDYLRNCAAFPPVAILVDAHVPGLHGGTGQALPWELLAGVDLGVPLILAGGLTPDNVAEAIRIVRPFAVDVASGVESAPGIKDAGKVRAFVQAAKRRMKDEG